MLLVKYHLSSERAGAASVFRVGTDENKMIKKNVKNKKKILFLKKIVIIKIHPPNYV